MLQATRLEAGVDWLTLTMPQARLFGETWYTRAGHFMATHKTEDNSVKRETLNGYQGFRRGTVFVGMRDDGYLLNVSSSMATEAFRLLWNSTCNCTRIDLQVTVWYAGGDTLVSSIGEECYEQATRANERLPEPKRRNIRRLTSNDGGYTTYIGAPSSERSSRIYNKSAQSEDRAYRDSWRYEIQLRGKSATNQALSLADYSYQYTEALKNAVVKFFRDRGVRIPLVEQTALEPQLVVHRKRSDTYRRMNWLLTQVNPAIRQLLDDGVSREQILLALGLINEEGEIIDGT